MYNIGSSPVGYSDLPLASLYPIYTRNKWQIEWNYKDGGFKKLLNFDVESYITKINFELNEKICGICTISMVYIDFPINIDDEVTIRYNGNPVFSGYIESIPDIKGGKVKIQPYHKRFDSTLYNGSFTGKTIKEIFKTIIQAKESQTGIRWNESFITITDTDTYTYSYNYEKIKKIIDELVNKLDDTFWGVNAYKIFTVYQDETTVTKTLGNCVNQEYISVTNNIDYSKIKQTRYQVYRKVADGDSERVGEVGYGSGYNAIDLENVIHVKESKFNVTITEFTDTECKDFAYADLNSQQAPNSTKIKGYNIENGFPEIGKKWKVYNKLELVNKRIINCNALTADSNLDFFDQSPVGWGNTGGTLSVDTSEFVLDGKSIKYVTTAGFTCNFLWGLPVPSGNQIAKFKSPVNFNIMMKSSNISTFNLIFYGSHGTTTIPMSIENINKWVLYEFDFIKNGITDLYAIRWEFPADTQKTIYIDSINIFGYFKDEYEGNIKSINIDVDKKTTNQADIDLNFYDKQLNDSLFATEKRVEILESITQET